MTDPTRESIDRALRVIQAEEDQKRLLNDRSQSPALRPSQDYIEASIGKERTPEEVQKAVIEKAKLYDRNSQATPEYVEHTPKDTVSRAVRLAASVETDAKEHSR